LEKTDGLAAGLPGGIESMLNPNVDRLSKDRGPAGGEGPSTNVKSGNIPPRSRPQGQASTPQVQLRCGADRAGLYFAWSKSRKAASLIVSSMAT
jgi:hypothetical protein